MLPICCPTVINFSPRMVYQYPVANNLFGVLSMPHTLLRSQRPRTTRLLRFGTTSPDVGVAMPLRLTAQARRVPRRGSTGSAPHPADSYIICTNPRSGSWLLSDGLSSTGVAGHPREWFNTVSELRIRGQWRVERPSSLRFSEYVSLVSRLCRTPNGIGGLKLHRYQLQAVLARNPATRIGDPLVSLWGLQSIFPSSHFVWLRRKDTIAQAISYVLAATSDRWWQVSAAATDQLGDAVHPDDPAFDWQLIDHFRKEFASQNTYWGNFFTANKMSPLVISYESLAVDPISTIRSVLNWLRVPNASSVEIPAPRLVRQSGAVNSEWHRRYLEGAQNGEGPAHDSGSVVTFLRERERLRGLPGPIWRQWIVDSSQAGMTTDFILQTLRYNGHRGQDLSSHVQAVLRSATPGD